MISICVYVEYTHVHVYVYVSVCTQMSIKWNLTQKSAQIKIKPECLRAHTVWVGVLDLLLTSWVTLGSACYLTSLSLGSLFFEKGFMIEPPPPPRSSCRDATPQPVQSPQNYVWHSVSPQ